MAKARTAKQRAALRKAQLASARKRKGKGKSKTSTVKSRRRLGGAAKAAAGAALVVGGIAAGYYGAGAYSAYRSRKNYKNPKPSRSATAMRNHKPYSSPKKPKTTATRSSSSSSSFDSRYNAAVAYRNAQVNEAKRKRKNAKYARQLQKMRDRGLYNAGLSSNIGGRTFVAGRGGTYRR